MWHDLKNIFHFIISFQCLFFIVMLLFHRTARRSDAVTLAVFLCSIVMLELDGISIHFIALKNLLDVYFPNFRTGFVPFRFLYAPSFYLFVVTFTKKEYRFRIADSLHGFPFLLLSVLLLYKVVFLSSIPAGHRAGFFEIVFDRDGWVLRGAAYVQFFSYAAGALIVLRKYTVGLKSCYSWLERASVSWLRFAVIGFISWRMLQIFESLLWDYYQHALPLYWYYVLYILAEIIFLALLSALFWRVLKQPSILLPDDDGQSNTKYEKILLSEALKEDYKNRLLHYMEAEKPYLNPTVNLPSLAKKISIPHHYLSQVLNTALHQNFYDFINSYRIKECMKILGEDTGKKKTILEIVYETGFNSKSVFNAAFKKYTGMTPSQYQKRTKGVVPAPSSIAKTVRPN